MTTTHCRSYWTYEDLQLHLDYVKGNYFLNLVNAISFISPDGKWNPTDWKLVESIENGEQQYCCCSHEITKNYIVKNVKNGNEMVLGSECIKRFKNNQMNEDLSLLIRTLDNPNIKFCCYCNSKRAIPKKIVEKYPNRDRYYHKACLIYRLKYCEHCGRDKDFCRIKCLDK